MVTGWATTLLKMQLELSSETWTWSVKKITFKHNRPGDTFVKSFKTRHHKLIAFSGALRQESIRFNTINADTLTTHIAAVEQRIQNHNIDPCR